MPTKITKNSFQGGMDKDTDPKQVDPTKASDIYNLSLSQDGRDGQVATFKAVELLKTGLGISVGADHSVWKLMGAYEARYLIDGTETLMMIVFLYNPSTGSFQMRAIKEDGTDYIQYSETLSSAEIAKMDAIGQYFTDCIVYKESGTSYAYFCNGVTSIKKIPLVITPAGKGDTDKYETEEIDLIRRGFRGGISALATSYGTGGDLLAGTYQFAVRLLNNDNNRYTKWSLLSNPVFVGMEFTTSRENYGGVGYVTDGEIEIDLSWEQDYTAEPLYTHYQLAVIENVDGITDDNLTVKVLQPETLSAATDSTVYDTNKIAKELISIDDLTVDDAAIKSIKTLAIKNNRLIAGNVSYHPLNYDNGDPSIGSTTTVIDAGRDLTGGGSVGYRDPDNASNKVGYFRDELYRFGVVYEDKYGNYSKPKILDFSALIASNKNWADEGIDFRFPPRSNGKYGTLLNSSDDIQALGLAIKDLDNHPTWAVAAHIVRVPRKKKILFQTPLIPSILVQPAKANGAYPDQRSSTKETDIETLNVEAANPDGTFIPKNFYHVLPKNMVRFGDLAEVDIDNGSIYGTHADATSPMSALSYAVIIPSEGLSLEVAPATTSDNLVTINDNSLTINLEKIVGGGVSSPFEATDTGTFRLYRRTKGSGSFALFGASVIDISATPEPEYTSLDLTTYDYLVELEDS